MPALCNTAQVRMEECGTASGSGDAGSILGCSFVFHWAAGALWDVGCPSWVGTWRWVISRCSLIDMLCQNSQPRSHVCLCGHVKSCPGQ